MSARVIDLRPEGVERAIGAWVLDDDELIVDPGPEATVERLVDALGDWRPRAIALTHIHLDHAGATGALVERWAGCEVWVHRRGAPHVQAPERLLASAARVYGDQLPSLFGGSRPVPADAIRVVGDGERAGPFDVLDAPGHARHHVVYVHTSTGAAYTGDVAGVRVPPAPLVLAPTVAPEFDPEAWHTSIRRLAERRPTRLALTHFGAHDDVERHLAAAAESVTRWAEAGRALGHQGFTDEMHAVIEEAADADTARAYVTAIRPEVLWPGARRYWDRRAQESTRRPPG